MTGGCSDMYSIDCYGELKELSEQSFFDHFLKVFPRPNYKFEMIDVHINSIVPLCKYVYWQRLSFAKQLIALYQNSAIQLFAPCIYSSSIRQTSIVAPPVIEQRNGMNVLCDGMHRLFSIIDNGTKYVRVLVASNYQLPLPGKLNTWVNVKIMPEQLPVEANFINYDKNGLTGYSKFFNSEMFTNVKNMEIMCDEYIRTNHIEIEK